MKPMKSATGCKRIAFLCGGITLAVLLLLAFALTLRAYLGAPQTAAHEETAATEILFTVRPSVASENTDHAAAALSDLLAHRQADAAAPGASSETAAGSGTATAEAPTRTEPSESEALSASAPDADIESERYILNTNTKKFHFPSCASADTILPKNKSEYIGARERLIEQGYSPCKRCSP